MTKILINKMKNEKEKRLPYLARLIDISSSLTALKIVAQKRTAFVGQSGNRT